MTPSEGDPETLDDIEFDVAFSEFPPGTQLNNTYKVIAEIREGGMATIYEVEHVRQGTRHAAKVLKPGLLDDKHVSRMEREARVATSIHHPNVLRVTNMEETPGGRPFLVCDRLHGEDLRDRLARGPLSIDHALEYAAQTASAVAMVHRAEVVHRDIKPENLFLVDYGDGRPADVRSGGAFGHGAAAHRHPRPVHGFRVSGNQRMPPGQVLAIGQQEIGTSIR